MVLLFIFISIIMLEQVRLTNHIQISMVDWYKTAEQTDLIHSFLMGELGEKEFNLSALWFNLQPWLEKYFYVNGSADWDKKTKEDNTINAYRGLKVVSYLDAGMDSYHIIWQRDCLSWWDTDDFHCNNFATLVDKIHQYLWGNYKIKWKLYINFNDNWVEFDGEWYQINSKDKTYIVSTRPGWVWLEHFMKHWEAYLPF